VIQFLAGLGAGRSNGQLHVWTGAGLPLCFRIWLTVANFALLIVGSNRNRAVIYISHLPFDGIKSPLVGPFRSKNRFHFSRGIITSIISTPILYSFRDSQQREYTRLPQNSIRALVRERTRAGGPTTFFSFLRIFLILLVESYDLTILWHQVDPNPMMNPNRIESILTHDPNLGILHNKYRILILFMDFPDSTNSLSLTFA
jgi:hypothetical protein